MRKFNAILVLIIILLLIDHLVFGSLYMLGVNVKVFIPIALLLIALVLIHAVVSMIITVRAEKVGIKTHARYNKENKEFWLRRSSGMAILFFALAHFYSMIKNEKGIPNIARMPRIFNLTLPLLIFSVLLHLIANVRPMLIALGVRGIDKKEKIIKIIILLIMLFGLYANVTFVLSKIGGH